jgi:hypothetical protein
MIQNLRSAMILFIGSKIATISAVAYLVAKTFGVMLI